MIWSLVHTVWISVVLMELGSAIFSSINAPEHEEY